MTNIGAWAFYGCSGLTAITIPEGVTSIGVGTFSGCSSLTIVTINCSNVGSWFSGNTSIKEITLGEKVTSIGNDAFKGCSGLTIVTINCSNVGSWFNGNTSIKEITLGDKVTSIGNSAFEGCNGLTSVRVGSGVTNIGEKAFANCSKIEDFYCYAVRYPNVTADAFNNSYIDYITLHVPEKSLKQYKAHEVWGKFMEIVPIGKEGDIDPRSGDIDHDGHFTVSDITTLINMYLEYEGE